MRDGAADRPLLLAGSGSGRRTAMPPPAAEAFARARPGHQPVLRHRRTDLDLAATVVPIDLADHGELGDAGDPPGLRVSITRRLSMAEKGLAAREDAGHRRHARPGSRPPLRPYPDAHSRTGAASSDAPVAGHRKVLRPACLPVRPSARECAAASRGASRPSRRARRRWRVVGPAGSLMQLPSASPLAPSGVSGDAVCRCSVSFRRRNLGHRRHRISPRRSGQELAGIVINEFLVQRCGDALHEGAAHLTIRDHRIEDAAGIMHRDITIDPHLVGQRIDFDPACRRRNRTSATY